jgi:hypothetical protein
VAGDGFSTVNLANAWLNVFGNASFSEISTSFVQLHTGDPGPNGTNNVSSVTTRPSLTWGAASGGVIAITNTPTWASWGGSNGEVETDITVWSASSLGTFYFSAAITSPVTVNTGNTLQLTSLSISLSPLAS